MSHTEMIQSRIQALKSNRMRSNRSLTQAERIALKDQAQRFAALLAKLPTPNLP